MNPTRRLAGLFAVVILLVATACGGNTFQNGGGNNGSGGNGGNGGSGGGNGGGGGGGKGSLTLSGQDFTEMQIMSQMYAQLLEKQGYSVDLKLVQTRDVYLPELESGKVDVVPEYVAGLADALILKSEGPNGKLVTTSNVPAAMKQLRKQAKPQGITVLQPAKATDENAFVVTKQYAQANNLSTLSDLGALNKPIKLAAPQDCPKRLDCALGLKRVYGINITQVVPLDFGSTQLKDAVKSGDVQLGEVGTTDGSLNQLGLVLLKDDKGLQPSGNLVPAVNTKTLQAHPDIAATLNKLSATLTTSDLATLNAKVDLQRQQPEDVARQYLQSKGLL